jgi:hypothetical protein
MTDVSKVILKVLAKFAENLLEAGDRIDPDSERRLAVATVAECMRSALSTYDAAPVSLHKTDEGENAATIIADLVKALEPFAEAAKDYIECTPPDDWERSVKRGDLRRAHEALARAKRLDLDRAKWRHKKRGTEYHVVGDVRVQCETPLQDDEVVLLYQSIHEGSYGCRRHAEFNDGRFERIPLHPTPGDTK